MLRCSECNSANIRKYGVDGQSYVCSRCRAVFGTYVEHALKKHAEKTYDDSVVKLAGTMLARGYEVECTQCERFINLEQTSYNGMYHAIQCPHCRYWISAEVVRLTMRRRENTMMLDQLKRFNQDTASLEEALSLSAFAKSLRAEYVTRQIEVPEWLDNSSRDLDRFVALKVEEQKSKRIREIRQSLSQLETPSEKRDRLRKELEALDPTAAVAPATA